MRRASWASLLSVLAAGVATGQSGETIRMRTAGQPDRILKVVKIGRMADGHTLVDLKDVKTGAQFTLMDPSFLVQMKPDDRTPPPTPVPDPVPVPESTSFPPPPMSHSTDELPLARIPPGRLLTIVPLLNRLPASAPANPSVNPPTAQPIPEPVARPESIPAPPTAEADQVPRPLELTEPVPAPAVQPVSLAPVESLRPYVQSSLAALSPRYGAEPAEVRMQRELAPWVADLTRAVRPSVRMDAASALAEGRYGWRDEVKEYLVRAAAGDPAAVVRAHCISLLTQLGYATGEYRSFLATCTADPNTDVRVAAAIGLARLEPR